MASITISNNNDLLSQSPYLYLQGAGSDKSDGSASGVHLRWDFGEPLAEKHIPKGNLAASGSSYFTQAGFNKANDFVKIYRTSYHQNFPIIIDFAEMAPTEINDGPGIKNWQYKNIAPIPTLASSNTCDVLIRFPNSIKYNAVKQQYNPATDRENFLKNYNDVIEVEVKDRFMFSAYVQMQVLDQAQKNTAQIESISRTNKDGEDGKPFISNRKRYKVSGTSYLLKEDLDFLLQENGGYLEIDGLGMGEEKIMAENIQYIRFRGDNCFPTLLWLETYHDFLLGKNEISDWQQVAQLSLETDQNNVFNRLENASYPINGLWPKYKEGATVNVENYKTRWLDNTEGESLLEGVIKYLNLSKNADNLEANCQPTGVDTSEEDYTEDFEISYLALLKLVAFDFHIARMLGFGHIDTGMSLYDQYMYIAVYETTAALDGMPAKSRIHTYMTLPVGQKDYKLPKTPQLNPLKYGMRIDTGAELPVSLTDDNGYSRYNDSRAISLHVEPFSVVMKGVEDFSFEAEEFSYVENYTEPIQFGIAYKKDIEPEWRKPEINNDPEFQDNRGINEPIAVIRPDTEDDRIFTHFATEEGIHDYAVYGINWFSRVSPLSNNRPTDQTTFPVKNTLMPPLNLGVQLIQKEDQLIFTTQAEQDRLNEFPTEADKTLVRLTFEWNDIQASNYAYSENAEAEFFFREEMLNFVKGKIKSVTNVGIGLYDVRTESYDITSANVKQEVKPTVTVGKENYFVKSFLTTEEDLFEVQSVRQSDISGEGAIFTIKAPENRQLIDTNNNVQQVVNTPEPPKVGSIFSVPENASLTAGWPVQLTQKVKLKKFSNYKEYYTDSEGNTTELNIGGIFEEATITEFPDLDADGNNIPIPNSRTGIYRITFNNYVLDPHEDSNVEWYKGSIRIAVPLADGKKEMRTLEVWNIETKEDGTPTDTLQLIACDGTFNVDENYNPIPEYNEENNPIPWSGYLPIPTGDNIEVNYHPGYRVYFTHETNFNQQSLLPATGAGSKQTLIACRSTDINEKAGRLNSSLSSPGVILAREIIEPVAPEKPSGALFATRPNFYGKASYTFDTMVNTANGREPYALVFYRANEQIILDALYKHETVLQIQEDLAQIENDTFFTDRWNGLVNVETVTDQNAADFGQFKEWNGYRFPNPDNDKFKIPNQNPKATPVFPFKTPKNPGEHSDIVKLAIDNAFLPLTEQPVLYRHLKNSNQTSDKKPVIRDSDRNLIIPGTANYDGSPMAVRYKKSVNNIQESFVRFTDYTLDGASTSFFFYYAKEMNNTLAISNRSEILGPIQLINTAPPKAPEIRKFHTRPENQVLGDTTAVLFEINEYPEGEGINKILIYRALNSTDAMTVRTMQLAATINIDEPVTEIIDDFSDLDYYPFGETLYYRLVAVRTVKTAVLDEYEGIYETEDVLSYPTSPILANIIDVNNPLAPNLEHTATLNGDMLENVLITWNSTTHNGIYRLYQMNNSGNWTELEQEEPKNSLQYEFTDSLPKTDEDGDTIYYRFKVVIENSSGLFSLEENILTI